MKTWKITEMKWYEFDAENEEIAKEMVEKMGLKPKASWIIVNSSVLSDK